MAKKEMQEINAGSMADIAFLLLIFFLVATTMDTDSGLARKLPPIPEDTQEDPDKINERNIFIVLINKNDELLVEGEPLHISKLREKTKEFIVNPKNNPKLPDKPKLSEKLEEAKAKGNTKEIKELQKAIDLLGADMPQPKGIISLQNDRGTSYEMYIRVQNELAAAYNDIRNELAMENFGKKYSELDTKIPREEKIQDAIKLVYPQRISEAEPKNVGGE